MGSIGLSDKNFLFCVGSIGLILILISSDKNFLFCVGSISDKNFLFCVGSIGKLALCAKRKCVATYSVSGLWDSGCGFECLEKARIGTFQTDMG